MGEILEGMILYMNGFSKLCSVGDLGGKCMLSEEVLFSKKIKSSRDSDRNGAG